MNKNIIIWDIGNIIFWVNESKLPFGYFSKNQDWIDLENGKIDSIKFFKKYPKFYKDFNNVFTVNNFVINLIKKIPFKNNFYFSNTNDSHFNYLLSRFDIFKTNNLFLSFEIGIRKPEPESYIFVQNSLNTTPDKIFFIEDREKNLEIPKRLGWNTFLYNGNDKQLEKFLCQQL